MNGEIDGGVSPLKARQKSRGGKRAKKATRTSKQRGGFAKSKGKRGAGGRNVGGYNVQTRFSPRAAQPIRGGVTSQPYSYSPSGDIVVNSPGASADATATATATAGGQEWVPAEWGTRTKNLPTYRQAWDANNQNVQSKYDTFEDFEKAAIEWNEKYGGGGTESERYLIREGYFRPTGGTGSTSSASASASANKFTLRGNPMYRNFGIGKS